MKFAIFTLGCKTNQYETELMRESLLEKGYTESDLRIIQMCILLIPVLLRKKQNAKPEKQLMKP